MHEPAANVGLAVSEAGPPPSVFRIWWTAARPKTLWAAVAPVLVGVAMAAADGALHVPAAFCALLGAILIQVGTNLYNDYADFEKGADTSERKGPLRVTQAGWVTLRTMRRATVIVFGLAVLAGAYLIWRGGWPVLLIGVSSILFGVLYTAGRYALAYLGLADLFVLIFFGPVAVAGTYYVQALALRPEVVVAGLAPGLLSVAILLVNNIRDVEEDRKAGKRTLPVRFGRSFGVGLYAVCVGVAPLVPVGLYLWMGGHPWAPVTVALEALALPMAVRLHRTREPAALNALLGETARLLLLYSLVFSVGWLL
ncbi:MAG: 1,4-dihydroxy-2-naphthoate octaprenyltransferase [Rhodothermaceae bacterium]|nr:MAG: 1,4-dihydroxy-2-naphthoate octaprenyltransferase [Rhodothermaceae bacterium]